jgi:hypothetical protein
VDLVDADHEEVVRDLGEAADLGGRESGPDARGRRAVADVAGRLRMSQNSLSGTGDRSW